MFKHYFSLADPSPPDDGDDLYSEGVLRSEGGKPLSQEESQGFKAVDRIRALKVNE